jgi:hypothetical protein
VVTLQRKARARGFFDKERFATRDDQTKTDEIALNPQHFKERTTEQILSALVHEMVHQYEWHIGNPGRHGYHDKKWGASMKRVGLYPSDTAQPGGKETGWRVSHYIVPGGPFEIACAALVKSGCAISYVEVGRNQAEAQRKRETKTKFTCLGKGCGGLNAWAKADAELTCTKCGLEMEAE